MGTVPSAKGYLVSRFYVAVFKDNVKFLYDSVPVDGVVCVWEKPDGTHVGDVGNVRLKEG